MVRREQTPAYARGRSDYRQNKGLEDNPYSDSEEMKQHTDWAAGWLDTDETDNREYIGLGSSNTYNS